MSNATIPLHHRRVRQIAEQYSERGYRVTIEPTPESLPEFLNGFRPDIVAEGPDDSVIVEYKERKSPSSAERLQEVARLVEAQPGWRFELIVDGRLDTDAPETISSTHILELTQQSRVLLKQEHADAALLIAWAAVEAAMRLMSLRGGVELSDSRPGTVTSALYSNGFLEREDFDFLRSSMQIRNSIAHGFTRSGVDRATVERLLTIVNELLNTSVA